MTTESSLLPLKDFKKVVQNAPLFAIDLVVLNQNNEILVGERLNAPAKGSWFVPGGRVYKNESLEDAFKRMSKAELGVEIERDQARLLGLFDHFYEDSFFSKAVSTHYINAAHMLELKVEQLNLSTAQHGQYRWLPVENLVQETDVHAFSKVFIPALNKVLNSRASEKNERRYD